MLLTESSLPRSFYTTDACTLAQALLGKELVLETTAGRLSGIISETEAYCGITDRASHAYGGKRTPRNDTMYLCGGYVYVYLIYGIYHCLNITAAVDGDPQAVLIRRVIPMDGIGLMSENRLRNGRGKKSTSLQSDRKSVCSMTDGPGKLCTAFGITREMNGWNLCAGEGKMFVSDSGIVPTSIEALPRVGIDYAGEDKDKPWRYIGKFL